jgi:hypothetical protein
MDSKARGYTDMSDIVNGVEIKTGQRPLREKQAGGRPKKNPENRASSVTFYATDRERMAINKAAEEAGRTTSGFIRFLLRETGIIARV